MNRMRHRVRTAAAALCVVATFAAAQNPGPDVIVGDLPSVSNYGSTGNIAAFSVGTTSCNKGTQTLNWFSNVNQHPVIAQNMYRIKDDRFDMIGMSHLKHGFAALTGSLCDPCQNPGTSQLLGVGCSDPYGSSLNGSQGNLGPRFEVNAFTGYYPYPFTSFPYSGNIARRLQVDHADLDATMNAGALYFVEGHYVTPDDAGAGNHFNNASYRPINVSPSGGSYNIALTGATAREKAAIEGWADVDPGVSLSYIDVPGEGRFIAAMKSVDLGGNLKRYNYALHNLNSDRCARGFSIAISGHTVIQNQTFHDIAHHSGDPWDSTDWVATTGAGSASWATTQTYAQNANANAIRWGTCYSFSVETDGEVGLVTVELFKPGAPSSVVGEFCPPQPQVPVTSGGYSLNAAAPYDFIAIPAGTVGPTGDDTAVTANIGFSFPFYNTTISQVIVSSNGYLTLSGQSGTTYSNTTLPNGSNPNGVIAPFWDDLNPATAGQIRYQTVTTPSGPRFVAHWENVPRYGQAAQIENFQVILDPSGDITFTYVSTVTGGNSATIGIEDPTGAIGLLHTFNSTGAIAAGQSIFIDRNVAVPTSADLAVIGDASPFTYFGLAVLSTPNAPLYLGVDLDNGPTSLGALGSLDLGLGIYHSAIADYFGVFGVPMPFAVTDHCGRYEVGVMIGAATLPSGYTFYAQACIADASAPNGAFHISNPITFVRP